MRVTILILTLLPLAGGALAAQEGAPAGAVVPHRQDRAPNRPYSPEEALARMTVPEGFTVELVAAEPAIVNPLAMTFDDGGRIWVTESVEYPRKSAGAGRDRVKVLEDLDGDGRADRVTVFAEGLNIPSGIAWGHGGVWVLNAPDLLFFEADEGLPAPRAAPRVVLTGFGRADTHELPSSLTWGPDGWLYGLNGVFNGSRVAGSDGVAHEFTCALWRVHPRTRELEVVCEGTSNPWGLIFDETGSAIVSACHWAKDHIFHFVESAYYQRQAGPYPPYTWPIGSASDHGHQKTAFCGLAWLDTDAYPPLYRGRLVLGNVHGNCLNSDVLERDGSTYVSRAAPDLLTAGDAWFMPVVQKIGPDGCLYVLDWYDRYHCYQDAGRDPEGIDRARGRLYRLRHRDAPARAVSARSGKSDAADLAADLASPVVFHRERAQRLLTERLLDGGEETASAVRGRLVALTRSTEASPRVRHHALWALVGAGSLETDHHRELLAHPDPVLRAWAVRAAGAAGTVESAMRERIAALAFDASPDVQLQVVIAARKIAELDALPVLINALASCGEDRLIPPVVWRNLEPFLEARPRRVTDLAAGVDLSRSPAVARLLPRLVTRILSGPAPDPVAAHELVTRIAPLEPKLHEELLAAVAARIPELPEVAIDSLARGLRPLLASSMASEAAGAGAGASIARVLALRLGILDTGDAGVASLARTVLSHEADDTARLAALDTLIAIRAAGVIATVDAALEDAGAPLAAGIIAALARTDAAAVGDVVLRRYASLPADVQPLAVELLLERQHWARRLLDAALAGQVPEGTLHAVHLERFLEGNDREAIWAIEKRWGKLRRERDPERRRVVEETALRLREHPGDARAGQRVFAKVCTQCHRIYGEGHDVGPDLTTNGRASWEQLLSNILDPNLVIGAGYETTTVTTADGRVLAGLVVEDSPARVVLKLPGGRREAVSRAEVKFQRPSGLSLMPEGLESLLAPQDLADLVAFLALDGPPDDPPPRAIPGAPASE
ncbi:MAG: c-type cytochrome [Planctomycetes bacterium]|nr:c-type cytochrome [Planctomycetota bacterium]